MFTTSYFIQPPMTSDGLGYALHFDNLSIGNQKTINDLGEINLYQIPYHFLTGLKLVAPGYGQNNNIYSFFCFQHKACDLHTIPVKWISAKNTSSSIYKV